MPPLSGDDSDLDLGPLISPEELSTIVKKRPLMLDEVGCLAEGRTSEAADKKLRAIPGPTEPIVLRASERYQVTNQDLEVAERELAELSPAALASARHVI